MNSCLYRSGLDYDLWRFGAARCDFRGPAGDPERPFVAVLGGCASFGRFVERPFPMLLAEWLDMQVINLSVRHAGLTLIRSERAILDMASRAEVVVVQVLGAQTMSNPFYTVHPRRNDRFIAATPRLQALFPKVDFTRFAFVGHLMRTLEEVDPWAFDTVVEQLRLTWVENMSAILEAIPGEVVLLRLSGQVPSEPAWVDDEMLGRLDGLHAGLIEIAASEAAQREGVVGKRFSTMEAQAARLLPGPIFHAEVAEALAPVVARAKDKRRAGVTDAPPETSVRAQSFSISSGTAVKRSATRP